MFYISAYLKSFLHNIVEQVIFLLKSMLQLCNKSIMFLHSFQVSQVVLLSFLIKFNLSFNLQFLFNYLLIQFGVTVWHISLRCFEISLNLHFLILQLLVMLFQRLNGWKEFFYLLFLVLYFWWKLILLSMIWALELFISLILSLVLKIKWFFKLLYFLLQKTVSLKQMLSIFTLGF